MAVSPPAFSGLIGAVRALTDGLLGSLEKRLQLIALELHEEKLNLVRLLLWPGAIFVVGLLALAFASLAIVYVCGEQSRFAALAGVAVFHAGALLVLIVAFRCYLQRQTVPFSATLEEVGKDRACIRKAN